MKNGIFRYYYFIARYTTREFDTRSERRSAAFLHRFLPLVRIIVPNNELRLIVAAIALIALVYFASCYDFALRFRIIEIELVARAAANIVVVVVDVAL